MPFETLALLVLFVLLPLVELLVRFVRRQMTRPPALPSAQRQVPPLSAPASVPSPAPVRPTLHETVTARTRTPERGTGERSTRPPTARQRTRRRATVAGLREGLRTPGDLRRAVVLMTILGPCRSISPHDTAERAGGT